MNETRYSTPVESIDEQPQGGGASLAPLPPLPRSISNTSSVYSRTTDTVNVTDMMTGQAPIPAVSTVSPPATPRTPARPMTGTHHPSIRPPEHKTRIIVLGASGFIGSNVVKQGVKSVLVDEVIVITRSLIQDALLRSPKVKVIIKKEFSGWGEETWRELDTLVGGLSQCAGCIWAIGGKVEDFPDSDTARKVGIGYTVVAAEAFRDRLLAEQAAKPDGQRRKQPFRFVYCSAAGSERNQHAKLWVQNETRKIKGSAENGIFDIAGQSVNADGTLEAKYHIDSSTSSTATLTSAGSSSSALEAYSLRPGSVLAETSGLIGAGASALLPTTTRADILANALIEVCRKGTSDGKFILENRDVNTVGGLEGALNMNSMTL